MTNETQITTDQGENCTARLVHQARYAVTADGRIFKIREGQPPKEKRLTPNSAGYLGTSLNGRRYLVHRLVCEAFHGPAPEATMDVAHNNGNRTDNRAENLRWATRAENIADQRKHGTHYTMHPSPRRRDYVAIQIAINKWRAAQRRNAQNE